MSPCCGQNKQLNAPIEGKLGRCRTCIWLSVAGMILSNMILLIFVSIGKFYLIIIFFLILAFSFTTLSTLHLIYYFKNILNST
jgi:hypothetical protein